MSGVEIKVEKLTEIERSNIVESTTNDEVEVLPTPEKVNLIVSIIDDSDENPPPVIVPVDSTSTIPVSSCSGADQANVTNQNKDVDVDVDGQSNNKKQKLMTNSETVICPPCNSSADSCSTLNDDHVQIDMENGNSTIIGQNQNILIGTSRTDTLEPSNCSSLIISNAIDTANHNDNSRYDDVKVVDDKIVFDVMNQEELAKKIEILAKLPDTLSVKTIEIQSDPEDNLFIGYKQIKALCSISLPLLEKLHFALNFHENITAKLFEDFLVKFGENLVHFHVTGGYIGVKKEEIVIRIPPLPKLEHFAFQTIYNFDTSTEIIEPDKVIQDGGVELFVIEDDEIPQKEVEIPTSNGLFRITIFLPRLKCLKEIILGNCIKVITSDPFKSADSTVLSKIAEIFPKLEIVHLNLPSPFVLQQFIQIFSKLGVKRFYLNTSFLSEDTDVRILCGLYRAQDGEEERKIRWFGSHGNLDGFEKSEQEMEILNNKNKRKKKNLKILGLGSLKTLIGFYLFHIQRIIYFSKHGKKIGFVNFEKKFPGDEVSKLIQELEMMKSFKNFMFPSLNEPLEKYLKEKLKINISSGFSGIYPKLLKVNITAEGQNVKVEVKQENSTL